MAVTLTAERLYDEARNPLRKRGAADINIPSNQLDYWSELLEAATALVVRYAPSAPDASHNRACSRAALYWYQTTPRIGRDGEFEPIARAASGVLRQSGAMAILQPWKRRRAL